MIRYASLSLLLVAAALPAWAETAATVGDRTITIEEVEKEIRPQLVEIEQQRFDALSAGLDQIIDRELLSREAKTRGVSAADLEKSEIDAKVTAPTPEEVKALYDQHASEIGGTFEQVQGQLTDYIRQQRAAQTRASFLATLRAKYPVKVALMPPRIEVGTGGRAARGPANAPVTIISFSDYECPFCKRAEETVEQVITTYGDKIRFVHRDFPLSFHKDAHRAAQAARCSEDQGKFWEYHKKLFTGTDLSEAGLNTMAEQTGLDMTKFKECVSSGKYKAAVDKDMADGSAVGVTGTPAFFINGRSLSGAQPFEKFKEIIDAELAAK